MIYDKMVERRKHKLMIVGWRAMRHAIKTTQHTSMNDLHRRSCSYINIIILILNSILIGPHVFDILHALNILIRLFVCFTHTHTHIHSFGLASTFARIRDARKNILYIISIFFQAREMCIEHANERWMNQFYFGAK